MTLEPHSETVPARPRIQQLPDTLIDQIAAGEVIERPSSAVKELVENSLDAGASRIEIALVGGGIEEIRITDDGVGMEPPDLTLCVQRHATSKITRIEDLSDLQSFGFRGEALSSIASVARLTLTSAVRGGQAHQIEIHFGEPQGAVRPVPAPAGTTLRVRDLFSRIPARHKFLRSASTEFSHCARVVREIALGNPQVRFSLTHAGRRVAEYIAPDPRDRFRECLKERWTPIIIEEEAEGLHLTAFLSPPEETAERGELWLYINRRPVRNRTLMAAVRQAYQTVLGPRREPTGVLHLEVRRDWVDANAHPQKLEVRLLRESALYSWMGALVRKNLGQTAPTAPPELEFASESAATSFRGQVAQPSGTIYLTGPQIPPSTGPRYLGISREGYWIVEDTDGLSVIDPEALISRHRFEQFQRQIAAGPLPSRRLARPEILRLPTELVTTVESEREWLGAVGLDVEPFGTQEVAIRAIPEALPESEIGDFLREVLICLRESSGEKERESLRRPLGRLNPVLASLACHSVVPTDRRLSPVQAQEILNLFDPIQPGWTCPRGRQVAFRLDIDQLRRHFEHSR